MFWGTGMNKAGICARCGHDIDIHEFVHNVKLFVVLKTRAASHFCNYCIQLVTERKVEK